MFGVFFPIFIVDYVLFEFQSRFHSKEILWCIRDFPTGKKVHYFPSVKQLFVGELYHGAILRIIQLNQDFFEKHKEQNFLLIIFNQPQAFLNLATRRYTKFMEEHHNFHQTGYNLNLLFQIQRLRSGINFIPNPFQLLSLLLL